MTATPRRVVRRLLRAPMFTLIAVFTLALGIGANTAIFSVVRGVLLKPLPFDDADRLVGLWHTAPGLGIPLLNMAPSYYFTYREEGRVFEDVGLWNGGAVSVTGTGEPERVQVLFVTDGTLSLLHVNPILGRHFTKDDDSPKTPERVHLEPRVLGKEVRQRSGCARQVGRRRWQTARDHRRTARRVPLPRSQPAADSAVPLRPSEAACGQLQLSRRGTPQARRHDGAGERRRRADDSADPRSLSNAARLHAQDAGRREDWTERSAAFR